MSADARDSSGAPRGTPSRGRPPRMARCCERRPPPGALMGQWLGDGVVARRAGSSVSIPGCQDTCRASLTMHARLAQPIPTESFPFFIVLLVDFPSAHVLIHSQVANVLFSVNKAVMFSFSP